jgi:hypothetical protein
VLEGYMVPSSPAGKAAENTALPWHYAGDLLAIEFWASPDAAAATLGPALTPDPISNGHAWAFFVDWQFTAQDDDVLDSVPDQYREFYVLLDAMWRGAPVMWCPHAYVDKASAMARGWGQGYPKRMGVVSQTRSFPTPGRASAALGADTRLSASLSVCGQRQAEACITLRESMSDASQLLRRPTVKLRYLPRFTGEGRPDRPRVYGLVTDVTQDAHFANAWHGEGQLHLPKSAREELDALAPVRVGRGYRWSMSCTVSDVRVLESFTE